MKPKQYTKYFDDIKISGTKEEVNDTIKKIKEKFEDGKMAHKLYCQYPSKNYNGGKKYG